MSRVILALILVSISAPALASSPVRAGGNLGLGLGGGFGVSGLSGKYFLADQHALQGLIGDDFVYPYGRGTLALGLDYLFEMPSLTNPAPLDLGWNFGAGGTLVLADNGIGVGASAVLGLEFNFDLDILGLDVVLEYRPGVVVVPDFDIDVVNFSCHIRVYPFK